MNKMSDFFNNDEDQKVVNTTKITKNLKKKLKQ